jgi:hypothetical protein
MNVLLILIMGLTLTVAAVILISLTRSVIVSYLNKSKRTRKANNPSHPDIEKFNCRAFLRADNTGDETEDLFTLEICGTIHAPNDQHQTTAKVFVSDITDGVYKASSIHGATDQWHMKNTPIFCHEVDLGSLPKAETVLSDWMTIADIPCDALVLPKKGARLLQFRTSIFTQGSSEEIAHGSFEIVYENQDDGYLDTEGDVYHANTLGVSLALGFASSGGKKAPAPAIDLIKKWAKGNLDIKHEPVNSELKARQILARVIGRFAFIENIRATEIPNSINKIAPLAVKCNIIMLCMSVISTCDSITDKQIAMLKNTAKLFEIDTERLRAMIEDIRPFAMYEVKDLEICLGITSNMNDVQIRKQLSSEYQKWNSRVVNKNAEIRDEAENMLELIGEAKEALCV